MRAVVFIFVLSMILIAPAQASLIDDFQRSAQKLVIYTYNMNGNIGGLPGTADWVRADSAQFTFKNYGTVTFNSAGYGENQFLKVQLNKQYDHYFCQASECGGASDWISDSGTITWLIKPPRPYNKVINIGNGYAYIERIDITGSVSGYYNPTWDTSSRDRTNDAFNQAINQPELVITNNIYTGFKPKIDDYVRATKRTDIYLNELDNVILYKLQPGQPNTTAPKTENFLTGIFDWIKSIL